MDGFAADYTYYIIREAASPSQSLRDSSPKGRALGKEGNFSVLPRAPSVRELARKRLKEFVFYLFFSCSSSPSRGVI